MQQKIKIKNIVLVFIFCLLCICSITILSGCGQSIPQSDNTNSSKEPENTPYYTTMNKKLEFNYIQYKVTEAIFSPVAPTTLGGYITADYLFLLVAVEIYNNGYMDYYEYLSNFYLLSPTLKIYTPTDYIYIVDRLNDAKIAPGFRSNFLIAFEIPLIEQGNYQLVISKLDYNAILYITLDGTTVYE